MLSTATRACITTNLPSEPCQLTASLSPSSRVKATTSILFVCRGSLARLPESVSLDLDMAGSGPGSGDVACPATATTKLLQCTSRTRPHRYFHMEQAKDA